MRISTSQIFQRATNGMLDQQAALSKTQIQMSTGKKLTAPSDDPVAAAQALQIQNGIDAITAYQKNADAATASLSTEENALSNAADILQRARELAVQANSAALSDTDRKAIVQELQQHIDGLMAIANTRDGNGDYVFAGFSAKTEPFSQTGAGVAYSGDQGQREVQIGANRQVTVGDPGSQVFMAIRNGNGTFTTTYNNANTGTGVIDLGQVTDVTAWVPDTYTLTFTAPDSYEVRDSAANLITSGTYTSGNAIAFNGVQVSVTGAPDAGDSFTLAPSPNQDVFATLQNLINALNGNAGAPAARAKLTMGIDQGLGAIDLAMERFSNTRTSVGARLNAIDSQNSANDAMVITARTDLSAIQDLDYAEAASRLNQQLLGLQAAQQSFARLQSLSLFNYL